MAIVQAAISALGIYFAAGLIFGIAFISAGVQRIDHVAAGARFAFRLIILPGVTALWPLLLKRWIQAPRSQS